MFILMYSMCVPSCLYCAVLWAAGVGVSNKSIINKNMFWPASSFKQVLIRPAPLNKLIRPAPLKVVNFNSVRRVLQDGCSRKGKEKKIHLQHRTLTETNVPTLSCAKAVILPMLSSCPCDTISHNAHTFPTSGRLRAGDLDVVFCNDAASYSVWLKHRHMMKQW